MNSSLNVNDTLPYALVTGGSKGIGYAIAAALARRNYNLILVARDSNALSDAKRKLEALYPQGRSDRGKTRKIDDDTALGIIALRKELPATQAVGWAARRAGLAWRH
jgi:short-subunit dehydrogenase